jgi:hypothetical protein
MLRPYYGVATVLLSIAVTLEAREPTWICAANDPFGCDSHSLLIQADSYGLQAGGTSVACHLLSEVRLTKEYVGANSSSCS